MRAGAGHDRQWHWRTPPHLPDQIPAGERPRHASRRCGHRGWHRPSGYPPGPPWRRAWRILSGGRGMQGQLTYPARANAIVIRRPAPIRLGSYRLLEQIGAGGTAVVHLAVAPGDQMVAVKMLRPPGAASPVARSRFEREV